MQKTYKQGLIFSAPVASSSAPQIQ